MKFEIIFITFLLCNIVLCTDYCLIENETCIEKKHIGCEKNFLNVEELYAIQPMTENLKEFILNILNNFRSDIAMGKYKSDGFLQASNMRAIRWNNEYGYLSELLIRKIPINNYSSCVITDSFITGSEVHFSSNTNDLEEDVFRNALNAYKSISTTWNWTSRFYHSNIYQYGCGIGHLKHQDGINPKQIIKCIQNRYGADSVNESYDFGRPCSKCGIWNEICGMEYQGLCVPGKYGLRGKIGLRGPAGAPCVVNHLDFQYPMSFWILYSLMCIGVIFSILLSLEVIRNGYKTFILKYLPQA